jgi:hypothetical protein
VLTSTVGGEVLIKIQLCTAQVIRKNQQKTCLLMARMGLHFGAQELNGRDDNHCPSWRKRTKGIKKPDFSQPLEMRAQTAGYCAGIERDERICWRKQRLEVIVGRKVHHCGRDRRAPAAIT